MFFFAFLNHCAIFSNGNEHTYEGVSVSVIVWSGTVHVCVCECASRGYHWTIFSDCVSPCVYVREKRKLSDPLFYFWQCRKCACAGVNA